MLFCQLSEAAKAAAAAAATATEQISDQNNPLLAVLWAAVTVLAVVSVFLYWKADTATKNQSSACTAAVAAAREGWAEQQAIDNGHAADLLRQSQTEARESRASLERMNQELRIQDKESVKTFAAVATAMGHLTQALQQMQFQLVTIETYMTGRPARPPHHIPAMPTLT